MDIVLTRLIGAPLDRVWRSWTDSDDVLTWWGPAGFTCGSAVIDLREGGRFVWNMHAPDELGGFDMYTAGRYDRIEPLSLIEFTQWLADADGEPINPATLGMPADFPRAIRSSVQFESVPGGTRLIASEFGWIEGIERSHSEAGLSQCLDKLEAVLAR
jgi:uncharacterized protein YndB with AHSA1/START domain